MNKQKIINNIEELIEHIRLGETPDEWLAEDLYKLIQEVILETLANAADPN